MKKHTSIFAAATLAAVATAACGSSGNSPSGTSSATAAAVAGDTTAILRFQGLIGAGEDPIHPTHVCEPTTLRTIYDALFDYDASGKLVPRLATGYKLLPDNVLELSIRQGVKFQDGTGFDASAVKFNLDRAMNDPDSTVKTTLVDVSGVTVVNPTTVRIAMKRPAVQSVLGALATRVGMMASPTAVTVAGSSANFAKAPVGTGPYKVVGTYQVRQSMSVRRWAGYWDAAAQTLGGIDFSEIPFTSLVNAIQAGDVDWVNPQSLADGNSLKSNSNVHVLTNPSTTFRLLVLNPTIPPFNDLRVRQALSYAIDREAIMRTLWQGTVHSSYQEFPPTSPAYDKSLDTNPMYPYNPAKATALLQQAGYPNGFSFDAVVGSSATAWVQMAEIMQAQLKAVGVTLNVKAIDTASVNNLVYFSGPQKSGTAAASSNGGQANVNPDVEFHDYFMAAGTSNAGRTEPAGLSDLIAKAEAAPDAQTAAKFYQQANRLVVEQVADGIPIGFDPAVTATASYVGGVTHAQSYCDARFNGVYITKGHAAVPGQ
jgi:peptide/nickel transport system substrate-binding protein